MAGDLGGGEDSGLGGFEGGFGGGDYASFGDTDFGGGVDDSSGEGGFFGDGILSTLGDGGLSPFSLEANKALARKLAIASIRPRLAQFQEGIASLTSLANASPMALTQRLAPQIEQARAALQHMFKQSSQRFGQFGGGQAQREQARGAEAIGGQLTRLFGNVPEQARNALLALIQGFQITPQPPTPITQISSQPFNPASVLGSLQGGYELGEFGMRAYQGLQSSPPGVSPSSAAGLSGEGALFSSTLGPAYGGYYTGVGTGTPFT